MTWQVDVHVVPMAHPADWSALGQPVVVRAPDEPALKHPSPNIRAALTALASSLR